jgi:hypothetical protein
MMVIPGIHVGLNIINCKILQAWPELKILAAVYHTSGSRPTTTY